MESATRFVSTRDGVRIAYCVRGSGPPLVFVRGWIGHFELMWLEDSTRTYFQALAKSFRLVQYDCRGNGLSDRDVADVSLEGMVMDLEAVVDELGIDRFVLYGMGYGGQAAVAYAAAHPDRVSKLVLFMAFARAADLERGEATIRALLNALHATPEVALAAVSWATSPDEPPGRVIESIRRMISPQMLGRLLEAGHDTDVSPLLPHVRAPTLVLHRRAPKKGVPTRSGRELASLIPDARFVSLSGASANPWTEEPEASLSAIGDFLGVDVGMGAPAVRPSVAPIGASGCVFRKEGEYWTVAFEGRAIRLRDTKGLQYVAHLLRHPGREFHVVQLVSATEGRFDQGRSATADDSIALGSNDAGEVVDEQTRRAYEARVRELREEIAEAQDWDDAERAARGREELDAIASQLSSAFGLGGRARRAGDAAERARKAVANRIKSDLDKIRREHEALGSHLAASVKTGLFCSYQPERPLRWES